MKGYNYLQTQGHALVVVGGSWQQASDAALTDGKTKGKGFTAAITCAFSVTLTFDEPHNELISFTVSKQLGATTELKGQVRAGAYTAPSGSTKGTMVVEHYSSTGSTITWNPSAAENRINFVALFRDSAVVT